MIRLTVLYNLKPDQNDEEFLRWRLSSHQDSNLAIGGVLRTDFAKIYSAWPDGTIPQYKYMTVLEWNDRDSFEKGFYDPMVQVSLRKNVDMLSDPQYFISEILVEGKNT